MINTVSLIGTLSAQTTSQSAGYPGIVTQLDERFITEQPVIKSFTLASDAAQVVQLDGLSGVNFLMVKTDGNHVKLTLTSSDGTAQSIPVDTLFISLSRTVAYTAITITRDAGVPTDVTVTFAKMV